MVRKKQPRNEWLICEWSPEHAQKRRSYLGLSLERCCLARSKSTSLPRATSPCIKHQSPQQNPPTQGPGRIHSDCDEAIITPLVCHPHWHLPTAPAPQPQADTHTGVVQSNPEPPNTTPACQSGSDGLMHPSNAKPSLCHFQASSFPQSAFSSTFNRARAQQEIQGSDHVELKPVAKQSCSAWFFFKVLFLLHLQVIWNLECCFLHPVRRWSKP